MPVKPPKAASDADIDSWLKKEPHPDAPIAQPSASAREPEPSELGYGQQISRGARKSVASLGVDTARFGNKLLGISAPGLSQRLGELASQSPTAQRLTKFADEPYQSVAEGIGGVGADIAEFALQPEMGIERGALGLAGRYGPAMAKYTGMLTKAGPKAGQWVPTTFGKVAKAGAQIAEGSGKGAVAGAITDPDDPKTGAISGAVGGGLPPALGGPAGRAIMGAAGARAPHLITAAVANFLGLPHWALSAWLPALLHGHGWHAGRHAGEWLYDKLGNKIARIPAGAAGAAASQTATRAGLSSTGIPWNVQGYGTIPTQQALPADSAYRDENDYGQSSQAPAAQ